MVSSPRLTSGSIGRSMSSSVWLSEVTGASEFMISWVRMRESLLHDSTWISLTSLLMSLTEMTRRCLSSSVISAQPSVSVISPVSVVYEMRSFSPGRMAASARAASGADCSSCRMWVRRCRPKMRNASPLAW